MSRAGYPTQRSDRGVGSQSVSQSVSDTFDADSSVSCRVVLVTRGPDLQSCSDGVLRD